MNDEEKIKSEDEPRLSLRGRIKNIQYKKLIKGFTLLTGLILIVFMTITNITFDPNNLNFWNWLTSSLILVGIMVFGLLMGESVGYDKQSEKARGLYQTNLKAYKSIKDLIKPIEVYFNQFYVWFHAKENYAYRVNFLVSQNFDYQLAQYIVKYVEYDDLETLKREMLIKTDPKTKKTIKITKLSSSQVSVVEKLFEHKVIVKGKEKSLPSDIRIKAPKYSYFLSAFGKAKSGSVLSQADDLEKEIAHNKRFNRIWKISFSLVISLIWGMMTVQDFMDAGSAQAWLNLLSRLSALITSLMSGWASSVIDVKLRAEIVENKTIVLQFFKTCIDNGDFKPKNYEDIAEEEYRAQEKAKEEALKSVVEPEVVKEPTPPLLCSNLVDTSGVK